DKFPEKPELVKWVQRQRIAFKRGTLAPSRINRLNQIGFVWNPFEAFWEEMFSALTRYKKVFGHCNVPFQSGKDRLGTWVANQRRLRERGRLNPDQIERLDKLGFIWNPRMTAWEQWFAQLAEYKTIHGNCDVPQKCTDFEGL